MISVPYLRSRALHLLVPAIVASAILTQQPDPGLFFLGHAASIVGVVSASTILLLTFQRAAWPILVVANVFALRSMRWYVSYAALDGAYTLAFFVLFALAGGILAVQAPRVLARQLYWLCALSLPLMLLQLLGVGQWTQILRTDLSGPGNLTQVRTVGLWPGHVVMNALQFRPAGFFASNNTLSIFLLFAIAVTFSHWPGPRLRWKDVVVAATVVVSMAKIALLAFLSVAAWRFVRGDGDVRRDAAKATLTLVVLLATYAALFPGVFAYNLSPAQILLNVEYRVTDLAAALPIDAVRDWARRQSSDVVAGLSRLKPPQEGGGPATAADTSTSQSGFADMAPALPVVLVAALFLAPMYVRGWRALRARRPELAWQSTAVLIVVALTPIVTSYVLSTLYATMLGMAILPLLVVDSARWWPLMGEPNAPDLA